MVDKPSRAKPDDVPTVRPLRAPVVLVAGGPDELVAATRRAAAYESPSIAVEACPAVTVASDAAALRPFALVVSQDVYGFDPDEFAALARDVQAELVVLKVTNTTNAFLEQALKPSLRSAFRRYRTEQESGPLRR
jgi:ABC-type amino acid transport substrate-binding protein